MTAAPKLGATPAATPAAEARRVAARPGWAELREAAVELHAAEVLIGDAHAPARVAIPHLRGFWAAMLAAAKAAALAPADATSPEPWLAAKIPGLDRGIRRALRKHVSELDGGHPPRASRLRHHVWAARELFIAIEPIIGGAPLRRRRVRLLWTAVGLVLLFGPLAAYIALTRELDGEGPWRAVYYADRKLEQVAATRREDTIDQDWGNDAPVEVLPPDKFSIRFDTCLVVDEAGSAVFQVHANDAARVFIDGEIVVDAWDRDPRTRKRGRGSGTVELDAGVHHLRVEYFESLGDATIEIAASFDDEVPGALPASMLRYPGDDFDEDDPCAAALTAGDGASE